MRQLPLLLIPTVAMFAAFAPFVTFAQTSPTSTLLLPALYTCTSATIRITSLANYTLLAHTLPSNKLVFHTHPLPPTTTVVNWKSVTLPPSTTVEFTLIDQTSNTTTNTVQATVLPNPTQNTTCLDQIEKKDKKEKADKAAKKNTVPTIVGIVLATFFVLIVLLVVAMVYRRKKEKSLKLDQQQIGEQHGDGESSLNLNHNTNFPAGGGYMTKLVPGLKLNSQPTLPTYSSLTSAQPRNQPHY